MKTLDEIGVKHATDKSSLNHHYLGLYELLFQRFYYFYDLRILEIGVQFGNSLRTWRDYFGQAKIIGIDSIDNGVDPDGFSIIIEDAYTKDMLTRLGEMKFDIIIDDASHAPKDQIWCIKEYTKLLTPNGILIVEDVSARSVVPFLSDVLPSEFTYVSVEMTEGKSIVDSRLFIVTRK